MLRIVCTDVQDYQSRGAQYVNTLYDMCRRNLPDGFPGTFEVFTDDPDRGYHPGVTVRQAAEGPKGWYAKIGYFRPGLWDTGDRVIHFDLDTLILGPLDRLVTYDGPFAVLEDWLDYKVNNSSIMMWESGFGHHIWERYAEAGFPDIPGGDQTWIQQHTPPNTKHVQALFPGLFASYKMDNATIPQTASVCCFHGIPRPHEVKGWVADVWKVGGLQRAALDAICNTKTEILHANVRAALKRDVEWLKEKPAHDGRVVIVGGGPSLEKYADEVRHMYDMGHHVWALNGAARWLTEHGIAYDSHVLVDARPETADFIESIGQLGEYLLASQCDPAVFDAVAPGCVTLWHCQAPDIDKVLAEDTTDRPLMLIGGGSTVGLCAVSIAFARGYRTMHLYGFDSSYADGVHHAYKQTLNDDDIVLEILAGEEHFKAAPWMVQQAEEFCVLAAEMAGKGVVIHVAGTGLLPELARQMERGGGPDSGATKRARAILKRLDPKQRVYGAEIGVFTGALSSLLLESHHDLYLWMVDSWAADGEDYVGDSGDFHAGLNLEQQLLAKQAAELNTVAMIERRLIMHMPSAEAAQKTPYAFLDFAFIDADHSYEGCAADINAWWSKVKPGGWLCGHDYGNTGFPKFGVTKAVNEFVLAKGLELELDENFTWFVKKPS